MKPLSVWLFVTPETIAYHAPLSIGFSKQEYWSGLPFPFSRGSFQPRDQTQGSNPGLPHYRQTLYHLSHKGSLFNPLLNPPCWSTIHFAILKYEKAQLLLPLSQWDSESQHFYLFLLVLYFSVFLPPTLIKAGFHVWWCILCVATTVTG